MDDDFKRGVATATRWVFIGTPDNYESIMVKAGQPIPEGSKPRPWFLGESAVIKESPEKPEVKPEAPKKRRTTKKKNSS